MMTDRFVIETMRHRNGEVRGYAVRFPSGKMATRYEKRTYMSLKLCWELATSFRDTMNAMFEKGAPVS